MAVYSMTGYANAAASREEAAEDGADAGAADGPVEVEIRSVNGRFLDIGLRLPDEARALEPALRELLVAAFRRGKIELRVQLPVERVDTVPKLDVDGLARLRQAEAAVRTAFPDAPGLSVHEVLQWCRGSAARPVRPHDAAVLRATRCAVDGLRAARAREGARLALALREQLTALGQLADQAEPLVPPTVRRHQLRFLERWQDALTAVRVSGAPTIDPAARDARALDEAAAYAVRIDVAEELARLRAHVDEIGRLLDAGGELGKRLDFLTQELLREANTLGAKSASVELTGIALEMKLAIEQVREQVQNIE